jgi:hypothetical protein
MWDLPDACFPEGQGKKDKGVKSGLCGDSDKGWNLAKKGKCSCTGYPKWGGTDYCIYERYVMEYTLSENNCTSGVKVKCPEKTVCSNGACSPPLNVFFAHENITSGQWITGAFGGLSGADTICQHWADNASLGGTFKAWLSNGTVSAASRFNTKDKPYYLVDDTTKIADNFTDLLNGSLNAAINVNANGSVVGNSQRGIYAGSPIAWTGTNGTTGGFSAVDTKHVSSLCVNWTTMGGHQTGLFGVVNFYNNESWSLMVRSENVPADRPATELCNLRDNVNRDNLFGIYCFEN